MGLLEQRAELVCSTYLHQPVLGLERPGRRRQPTFRAQLPDRSVIVSRRDDRRRAELEVGVLTELGDHGAPIPRVLAYDGEWLIQEDLGRRRLSQALVGDSPENAERWLDKALESLVRVHDSAHSSGLRRRVGRIGDRPGWLANLLRAPEWLGAKLAFPAPRLPIDEIAELLRSDYGNFIKWDARPGNAIAKNDGEVAWFDWEHCGCREPLDDMAWLLGDDYTPDIPDMEDRLIARHLDAIAGPGSKDAPYEYLMAFGALHMCIRLNLILANKKGGSWLAIEKCLEHDEIGVALECVCALSRRAARWASRVALTEPLTSWLDSLPEHFGPGAPNREAA